MKFYIYLYPPYPSINPKPDQVLRTQGAAANEELELNLEGPADGMARPMHIAERVVQPKGTPNHPKLELLMRTS